MSISSRTTSKLKVTKVPLDSQGYTKANGQYRGTPNNVWRIEDVDDSSDEYGQWREVRAEDLTAAKRKAAALYPNANFGSAKKGSRVGKLLTEDANTRRVKKLDELIKRMQLFGGFVMRAEDEGRERDAQRCREIMDAIEREFAAVEDEIRRNQ